MCIPRLMALGFFVFKNKEAEENEEIGIMSMVLILTLVELVVSGRQTGCRNPALGLTFLHGASWADTNAKPAAAAGTHVYIIVAVNFLDCFGRTFTANKAFGRMVATFLIDGEFFHLQILLIPV